jgi:hypothetical protein
LVTASCANDTVSVFTNSAGATFALATAVAVGDCPSALASADFNGDGRPDLVSADGGSRRLTVLTNRGGSFGTRVSAVAAACRAVQASPISSARTAWTKPCPCW